MMSLIGACGFSLSRHTNDSMDMQGEFTSRPHKQAPQKPLQCVVQPPRVSSGTPSSLSASAPASGRQDSTAPPLHPPAFSRRNGADPFPAYLYPRAFVSSATDQSALAALPPSPFRLAVPCCGAGLGTLPPSVLSPRRGALPEAAPVRRRRAQRLLAPRAA